MPNPFKFNPENGFNDTTSFPDPLNESQVREQLFRLHTQTRDYINNTLLLELNGKQEQLYAGANINIYRRDGKMYIASTGGGSGGGVSQEYVDEMDATTLQNAKDYVDDNENGFLDETSIEDRLNSTAIYKSLSANMGRELNEAIDKLGSVEELTLPTTGWTRQSGTTKYYQDFEMEGVTALDSFSISPKVIESLTDAQEETYLEDFNKLDEKSTTKTDAIRIYISEQLTNSIVVYIKANGFASESRSHYEGEYEVEPNNTQQTLETNDLIMDDDVVVNPISYQETPNPQGGETIDIGDTNGEE